MEGPDLDELDPNPIVELWFQLNKNASTTEKDKPKN